MAAAPELVLVEAAAAPEAVPVVGALCAFAVCLGIIAVIDAFTRGLFGSTNSLLSWIPWHKELVERPLHTMEQKITNALGEALHGIDTYIGHSLHQFAVLVTTQALEVEDAATDALHIADALTELWRPKTIRSYVSTALHPLRAFEHVTRILVRQEQAERRALEHVVNRDLRPRIRKAEAQIEHVLEPEYEFLRERVEALQRTEARTERWIRRWPRSFTSPAFLAAAAAALAELGGGWIRCRNWRRIGRGGCGLPLHLIEFLLGLTVEAFLLRHVCEVAQVVEQVAIEVEPAITDLVLELEGFVCGGRSSAPSGIVASDWQRVAALPSGLIASDLA